MNITSQYPLYVLAELVGGASPQTIKLPPNSYTVPGVQARVVSAVGGTTPTLTLVDNASSPLTYINDQSVASLGAVAVAAGANQFYPAGATLTATFGGTLPAGGKVLVAIPYLIVGRQNEKAHG